MIRPDELLRMLDAKHINYTTSLPDACRVYAVAGSPPGEEHMISVTNAEHDALPPAPSHMPEPS